MIAKILPSLLTVFFLFACHNEKGNVKEMDGINFDVVWGGVYASKDSETGKYGIFRLIDFNQDAYHSALFSESFDEVPSLDSVRALSPSIGHAPIDARGLLNRPELQLIGALPVDKAFFEGYSIYLKHFGASESEVDELVTNLIGFSKEPPLKLRLSKKGEELVIEER